MGMVRKFAGNAAHGRFLEERALVVIPTGELMAAAGTRILGREIRAAYGKHDLAELAQATQDERVAKGYSPDDPLLRTGQLLRDSVEEETGPGFSAVHTAEPIAGYHEFGFFNVRAGKAVPPRSAFRNGLVRAGPAIIDMMAEATGVELGFTPSLSSDPETHTATYALEATETSAAITAVT